MLCIFIIVFYTCIVKLISLISAEKCVTICDRAYKNQACGHPCHTTDHISVLEQNIYIL